MKVQIHQIIHCGKENYCIRKKFEWNYSLPRIGEQVTSENFLCSIKETSTVKEVTHDISESICYIGLEECWIPKGSLLENEFENSAQKSGWECERI